MKAPRFEYARPETLEAALALLAEHGEAAAVLAGGQSLMPMLNLRMTQPGLVLDINRIPALDAITEHGDGLTIGARARHAAVLDSQLVHARAPLLSQALGHVAHAAIRNRGTFGGSLALADPAAELPACTVCLGATIVTVSTAGERRHAAGDFFTGLYGTARRPDEMILHVEIPGAEAGWRFAFGEVARRHGDYAITGLAFAARVQDGRISACRMAFCGIEPAPRRLGATEAACVSQGREAGMRTLDELQPMSSDDAPAAFRRHLAGVLLVRAIDRVLAP